MDKETKGLIYTISIAFLAIYLLRPKYNDKQTKDLKYSSKYNEPKVSGKESKKADELFEDAVVSLKAFRMAKNKGENQPEMEALNRMTIKDYGIRIIYDEKTKLFTATDLKGDQIACEND